MREISEHFGISVKGGYDHVKALARKKVIRCNPNRSRALEVVETEREPPAAVHAVPLLGKVAAGKPLFVEENFEGTVELPAAFVSGGKYFALNVSGDSMNDAGIHDGDTAIIRYQTDAENGDIVVALVDEEAVTLKRFYRKSNAVELRPENPRFHPIFSQNVRILGRLACLIRRYER